MSSRCKPCSNDRCIEALTRAGEYDKAMLTKAVSMFEVGFLYNVTPFEYDLIVFG